MDNHRELKKRPVSEEPCKGNTAGKDNQSTGVRKSSVVLSDRTVWVVFLSLLVDLLAFTVILPLFPSLLEFYASNREVSLRYKWYISLSGN